MKLKRILSFILASLMLLSATACGNKETSNTTAKTEAVTEEKMPEVPNEEYAVVVDKENAGAVSAAERMVWQMNELYGIDLEVVDHKEKAYVREIVLGKTNRGENIDTSKMVCDEYEIRAVGEKVFIDGASDEGIYGGAVKLLNTCADENGFNVAKDYSFKDTSGYPIDKLTINGNDISKYTILYPEKASANTMIGVNDLQKYIEKACGIKLETKKGTNGDYAIIVEEKTVVVEGSASKNIENYSVKTEADNIRITGDAARGAMYGCYDFLEDVIGCRFLTETQDHILPVDELDVRDVDYTEAPVFENRHTLWNTYHSTDMRNKHKLWYVPTTGMHTFASLAPGYSSAWSSQPCLTDENVYELMLENVLKLIEENPDIPIISVSQNDNKKYCKCDNCMAVAEEEGSQAGPIIRFVNRIADAVVAAGYTDVRIHTFAYMYSLTPPKLTKPRSNVIVQICSIDNCFAHPFTYECPFNKIQFYPDLIGWAEMGTKMYVYDYTLNHSYGQQPFANLKYEVLAGNMRLFAENGVIGVYEQGNTNNSDENGEFDRLRAYLIGKLLWDPYMTEEEYNTHVSEFMEGYYGDGWEKVYEAMQLWLDTDTACHCIFDNAKGRITGFIRTSEKLVNLMTEAELMSESKRSFENIDISQTQFEYVDLNIKFNKLYKSSDPADNALAQELSHKLQDKYQKYNIRWSGSWVYTPNLEEFTTPPHDWRWVTEDSLDFWYK